MATLKFFFLDTSAICRLVLNEPGSDKAKKLLGRVDNKIVSSWVCIAEALGVLKRKLREVDANGEVLLCDAGYATAITEIFHYIDDGTLKPIDIEENGTPKLVTYTSQVRRIRAKYPELDAVDAVQLAAISQSIFNHIDKESRVKLVSADRKLLKAARQEGLAVFPVNK